MIGSSLLALAFAATPASTITQVVVYPDRAQVTRTESLTCRPAAVVSFAALPPSIDANSLRATTSVGTIEGLRYQEVPHTEAFSKPIQEIETQIRELLAKDADLVDALSRSRESVRLADSYAAVATGEMSREITSAPPMNTVAWQSALDLALSTRLKAAQEQGDLQAKLRTLNEQINDRRRALARMQEGADRRELVAEVLVSCPTGGTVSVELTYLEGGAGWEPAYEARANESEESVELAAYATVQQSTGEAWSHARIVLSTAVPRQQATPPEIQPLKVWAEERDAERKVLVRRDEQREHAESAPMSPASTPVDAPARDPQPSLAAKNQGLSVQLTVPEPSDVAGDGSPSRLFIGRTQLSAKFALRTAPSVLPFVFRVADLINSAPFPLLTGPVDTFGKSGFIGRYPIERVAQGAPLHLTFGADDAMRVTRVVLEEVQRDTGIFKGNHRFRYGYRFELSNDTSAAREVELMEHYPVSELDDVKVEIDPKTAPSFENRAADGVLVWKVRLEKGQKREVELHFHVDVPSSYDLAGL